jgi:hypothetical protein
VLFGNPASKAVGILPTMPPRHVEQLSAYIATLEHRIASAKAYE